MKKLMMIFAVAFLATFFTANLFAQDVKFSIPLPLTGPQAKFGEIEKKSREITGWAPLVLNRHLRQIVENVRKYYAFREVHNEGAA